MTSSAAHSMLPALSADESSHSRAVGELIRRRITAAGGWLPFDEFMQLALYAPGLGYYSAGTVKLGAGGDFVTAPELSDLFSVCVANQCAEILAHTGGSMLELGAGTGRMAAAILRTLATSGVLPPHYFILEMSADLRARQQQQLQQLPAVLRDRVVWLDRLPESPLRGVIVANEVLDALPCERFVLRDSKARALGVGLAADGTFVWRESELCYPMSFPQPLPEGYRSELCTRVAPWIAALSAALESGAILLFDYGLPRAHYYHPQRSAGTLRCHFKQRAHDDPFTHVGLQDITAWTDFTRVAEAADAAGLMVSGFTTQAAFLLGAGIERAMGEAGDDVTRARLASEARQLLMPGEMGEIFKAMALTRDLSVALPGFAIRDLRASL